MTYHEAIYFLLHETPQFSNIGAEAYHKGFEKINKLLKALKNPEKKLNFIHVAGTNGKGSTCQLIAYYLHQEGYKVGLHTSPHMEDIRERFLINGTMVPKKYITEFVREYQTLILKLRPSFFEIMVAMAFYFFNKEQVDIVVLETGLGGRFDSTNVIQSLLTIITNISLDHVGILGNSITEIAYEKAGIIKENTPIILGLPEEKEAKKVIQEEAKIKNAPFITTSDLDSSLKASIQSLVQQLQLPIFQYFNIQTVAQTLSHLKFKNYTFNLEQFNHHATQFFEKKVLTGRWQKLQENPTIILDVGHNLAAIQMQKKALKTLDYNSLHIIIGMMKDKDVEQILKELPDEAQYYFTNAPLERALEHQELYKIAKKFSKNGEAYPNIQRAWEACSSKLENKDLLLITGSFPIIQEFISIYKNQNHQNKI